MSAPILYGLCGALLVGIGLYGLIGRAHLLRRIIGFNVVGSGIFLTFGSLTARDPSFATDPVPQAMIITGVVVALAGTAFALALAIRMHDETGRVILPDEGDDDYGGERDDR